MSMDQHSDSDLGPLLDLGLTMMILLNRCSGRRIFISMVNAESNTIDVK